MRRVWLVVLTMVFVLVLSSLAFGAPVRLYVDSLLADARWQPYLERITQDELRKAGFEMAPSRGQADYLLRVALLNSQNRREWNWFVILLFWWTWPFVGWTHDWVTVNVELVLLGPDGDPAFNQVFSGEAQEDFWFSDFRGPEYKLPEAIQQAVQAGMRSMRNLAKP